MRRPQATEKERVDGNEHRMRQRERPLKRDVVVSGVYRIWRTGSATTSFIMEIRYVFLLSFHHPSLSAWNCLFDVHCE